MVLTVFATSIFLLRRVEFFSVRPSALMELIFVENGAATFRVITTEMPSIWCRVSSQPLQKIKTSTAKAPCFCAA